MSPRTALWLGVLFSFFGGMFLLEAFIDGIPTRGGVVFGLLAVIFTLRGILFLHTMLPKPGRE